MLAALVLLVSPCAAPARPDPTARLEALWADLGGPGPVAVRAGIGMATMPKEATAFLRAKLRPVPAEVGPVVKRWAADLESDDPKVRERAAAELRFVAPVAEAELREADTNARTAAAKATLDALLGEARGEFVWEMAPLGARRVTRVVVDTNPAVGPRQAPADFVLALKPDALRKGGPPAEWQRITNAVGVLEAFGTPEATAVLRPLAAGHPTAGPTRAARAAVDRLTKRVAK